MTNHQITTSKAATAGSVDIDDDFSDHDGDVGGVDASAWIQQALQNPGEVSARKKKRRGSRQQHQQKTLQEQGQTEQQNLSDGRSFVDKDDFMSTDGRSIMDKSMDCGKSLECMSIMSLALSEVEQSLNNDSSNNNNKKKPKEVHASSDHHPHDSDLETEDGDSDLGSESINFDSNHGDRRTMGRSGASTHSVMSELTDFSVSDHEDDDDSVCL
jgi:hypothetical protein